MSNIYPHASGQVYFHAALPSDALGQLLQQTFAAGAFWLGTSAEKAQLRHAADSAIVTTLPATWPEGRAFSSTAEVRWAWVSKQEAGSDLYRVWLLGEALDRPLQQLCEAQQLTPLDTQWEVAVAPRSIYLWGQYTADLQGWVEIRVPHVLTYPVHMTPVPEKSFAGIGHVLYRAPNGAVQFTRLTVVAYREDKG